MCTSLSSFPPLPSHRTSTFSLSSSTDLKIFRPSIFNFQGMMSLLFSDDTFNNKYSFCSCCVDIIFISSQDVNINSYKHGLVSSEFFLSPGQFRLLLKLFCMCPATLEPLTWERDAKDQTGRGVCGVCGVHLCVMCVLGWGRTGNSCERPRQCDQMVNQYFWGGEWVWFWGFRSLLTLSKMEFVFLIFIFLVWVLG